MDYKCFFSHLIRLKQQSTQEAYAERLLIFILTTQAPNILVEGDVKEQFNIMNKDPLSHESFLPYIKAEKDKLTLLERVMYSSSEEYFIKCGEEVRSFWKYFHSLP